MKMHQLDYHHHQLVACLLGIFSLLLTITISLPQPSSAIDITKLSVAANQTANQTAPKLANLRLRGQVPYYHYRIEVTDDAASDYHLHLDCTSFSFLATPLNDTFNLTGMMDSSFFTRKDAEMRRQIYDDQGEIKHDFASLYRKRPEVSMSMANLQVLELYQRQLLRWKAPGSTFSLDEDVRDEQFKEGHFFAANADEDERSETWLYICLAAASSTFEEGSPTVGFLSSRDGRCKTVSGLLDQSESGSATENARLVVSQARRRPYRLLTRQEGIYNYTWVEIATTTTAASNFTAQWTPPPNAVLVDINEDSATSLPPVYIARFRQKQVNGSSLVIVGLPRRCLLTPLAKAGKLELLTVTNPPEELYQVLLRLAGGHHPVNSLAKSWEDILGCQQQLDSSRATDDAESLLLHWRAERRESAHKFNQFAETVAAKLSNKTVAKVHALLPKVTQWIVHQRVDREWMGDYDYFWGVGQNGSLFRANRPFYGRFNKDTSNYVAVDADSRTRPLCRVSPVNETYWVPGFLNMRTGRCLACSLNGTALSSPNYEVLYEFFPRSPDRLHWAPYQAKQSLVSGALLADCIYNDERPQVLIARLRVALNTGEGGGGVQSGSTHRVLYGSLEAGKNVFRYVEERRMTAKGYVTHAIEGAEEKGVQILAARVGKKSN